MNTSYERPKTTSHFSLLRPLAWLLVLIVASTTSVAAAPGAAASPDFIGEKVREIPREHFPNHPHFPRPVEVEIWTDRGEGATYRIGDPIEIYFRTSRNAYVTIYNLDTRGRTNVLFPSSYSGDNFVYGGQIYSLPTNGAYHLAVEGPRGREFLRAVASTDRGYRRMYYQPLGRGAFDYNASPQPIGQGVPGKLITEIPNPTGTTAIAETSFLVRPRYGPRPGHGPRYPPRYPRRYPYSGR